MQNVFSKKSLVFIACAVVLASVSSSTEAKVTRYLRGNAADVNPVLSGPVFYFDGGSDVSAGLQWIVDQVRGCNKCETKIDLVVLQSGGGDSYNSTLFGLKGVDSVETIVMQTRQDANLSSVESTVLGAEVVFVASDPCSVMRVLKGTKAQKATKYVSEKNGGLGALSLASPLMGGFMNDGCNGTVTSSQALVNPYHRTMSFSRGFFELPDLSDVLIDTQLITRDRMGRFVSFLARGTHENKNANVIGIAMNERTSLVIDRNGVGKVMGEGPAYFVLADHVPEACEPVTPLTFSDFKVWRITANGLFNLRSRPTMGFYLLSVSNGAFDIDPY